MADDTRHDPVLRVLFRVIHSPKDPSAYRTIILDYSGERSGDEDPDRGTHIVWTGYKFDPQVSIHEVYIRIAEDLRTSEVQAAVRSSTIYRGPFKQSPMPLNLAEIEIEDLAMTFWNPETNQLKFTSYVPHRKDAMVFDSETGRRMDSMDSIYEIAAAKQTETFVGSPSVDLYYYTEPLDFLREPIFSDTAAYTKDAVHYEVSVALKPVAVSIATEISSERARMVERVFFRPRRKVPRRAPKYYRTKDTKFADLVPSLARMSYFSIVSPAPRVNLRAMFRSLKLVSSGEDVLIAVSYARVYGSFNGIPRVDEKSEEIRVSKAAISRLTDISDSKVHSNFMVSGNTEALETINGHLARQAAMNPSETETKDPISEVLKLTAISKSLLDEQLYDSSGVFYFYVYDNGFVQVEYVDKREDHYVSSGKLLFDTMAAKAEDYLLDPSATYAAETGIPSEKFSGKFSFSIAKVELQISRIAYTAASILEYGPFMKASSNTYVYQRSSDYKDSLAKRLASQKVAEAVSRLHQDASPETLPMRKLLKGDEKKIDDQIIAKAEIFYAQQLSRSRSSGSSITWTPIIRVDGMRHNHVHSRMFVRDIFTSAMMVAVLEDIRRSTAAMFRSEFKNEDEIKFAIQKMYIENKTWSAMGADPETFAYTNRIFGTSSRYAMLSPNPVTPLIPDISDDEARLLIMRILDKSDIDTDAINILEFRGRKYTCLDPKNKFIFPKRRVAFTDIAGKDHIVISCSNKPGDDIENPSDVIETPKDTITLKKVAVGSAHLLAASEGILNGYGENLKNQDYAFVRFGPKKRVKTVQSTSGKSDFVSERVLSSLIEAFEYNDETEPVRERLAAYADTEFQKDMFLNDPRVILDETLRIAAKRGTFVRAGCNIVVIAESTSEKTKVLVRSFSPRNKFDPDLETYLFSEAYSEPFDRVLNRVPGQVSRFMTFTPIYVVKLKETGKFDYKNPFAKFLIPSLLIKKYAKIKNDDWDYGVYFLMTKVIAADQADSDVSGHIVSETKDTIVLGDDGETAIYVIIEDAGVILPIDKSSFSRSGSRRTKRTSLRDAKIPSLDSMVSGIADYDQSISSVVVDPEDTMVHGVILRSGIYVPVAYEQFSMDKLSDMMLGESIIYESDRLRVSRTGKPRDGNIVDYVSIGIVEIFKDFLKSMLYVSASKEARDTGTVIKRRDKLERFARDFVKKRTRVVAAFNTTVLRSLDTLSSARTAAQKISDLLGLTVSAAPDSQIPIPDPEFRDSAVSYIVSRGTGVDTPENFSKGLIKAYNNEKYSAVSKGTKVSDRLFEDTIAIASENFETAIIAAFAGPRRSSIIEASYF